MATTTEQILAKATELGRLIADHPAAARMEQAVNKLESDLEAQRLLNDYNRHIQTVAQKEASGRPIEVADKHKLEQLQVQVISNPLLGEVQMAQMDYLDLMRRVDDAMTGHIEDGGTAQGQGPAAASPLVNPDISGR